MTDPDAGSPAGRARRCLTAYLDSAQLPWEPGTRAGEFVVTLPGEHKLRTVASVLVRERVTSVSAFVIRNPDENHEAVYRYLLRRNLRLPMLGYALDASGDVFVRGSLPTRALDDSLVDEVLGVVLQAADEPFDELLVLGFLTSMRKEWAWRMSRGESLANLEPFRSVLEGSGPHVRPPRDPSGPKAG